MRDIVDRLLKSARVEYVSGDKAFGDELTQAAALIQSQADEIEALRKGLEPLARLDLPKKPVGNAGFYSVYHKWIVQARALLKGKEG